MNALVEVRSNATGLLNPTPEQRASVANKLTAAAGATAPTAMQTADGSGATGAVAGTQGSGSLTGAASPELGKDAFLQLLVLQMQNQDPLSPVDNQQMLAQLAQFSALEAMTNLNDNFETLSGNVDQLNFISASQLLGHTVRGIDMDGLPREGLVERVHLDGSVVVLTVDGAQMSMAGILEILPGTDSGTGGIEDLDAPVETDEAVQ